MLAQVMYAATFDIFALMDGAFALATVAFSVVSNYEEGLARQAAVSLRSLASWQNEQSHMQY